MRSITLWSLSIVSALLCLAALILAIKEPSVGLFFAVISFALSSIYLLLLTRNRLLVSRRDHYFFRWRFGVSLVSVLYIFAFASMITNNHDKMSQIIDESRINEYNANPQKLIDNVEGSLLSKDFFMAQNELDFLLKKIPGDQRLIDLKHKVFLKEIKYFEVEDKLYLFDNRFERYKNLLGESSRLSEVQVVYERAAETLIKHKIEKEDFWSAGLELDQIKKFFPSSRVIESLESAITVAKTDFEARKEVLTKREAARTEAARTEAARTEAAKEKSRQSSFSNSTRSEDPRNIYLYCIGTSFTCFTTPAECEQQKIFYSGGRCVAVACGTGVTIVNTAQCKRKGF